MDTVAPLLDMPFETLALLAAGYMAYRIAYTGKDASHNTIDVVFLTLVFAFVAKTSSLVLSTWAFGSAALGDANLVKGPSYYFASMLGVLISAFVACGWRGWGERYVFLGLRKMGISASDRHNTAWETVIADGRARPSSLVIRKKDGSVLMCTSLNEFRDAPFGPCVLGQDGSVALYVTRYRMQGTTDWEDVDPNHGDWGPNLTFVTASEIAEIEVRHIKSSLRGRWWRQLRGAR